MPKCNDASCNCVVRGGSGVSVTGGGTPSSPYLVQVDQSGRLAILDTDTIDLTLAGQGTADSPAVLSADLRAVLGDLLDVAVGTPTSGYVLAWTGGQWAPVPPATAAPGTIAVGQGLTGDGSSGAPLHAVVDPNGSLVLSPTGIAVGQPLLDRITAVENKNFVSQYRRAERSAAMSILDGTWTVPASMDLGVTMSTGTRTSYASGQITVLDAGFYVWEVTCVWATLAAQTSLVSQAVCIQINTVNSKYGQQTDVLPADDTIGGHRKSYSGTVHCAANDKLRPAFYQNNAANATSSVTPEAFAVYRVA